LQNGVARLRGGECQQYGGSGDQAAPILRVVSMLKAMLVTTATLAARTPAAPLMPQNHGVGPVLMAETRRMPVGNPKPRQRPRLDNPIPSTRASAQGASRSAHDGTVARLRHESNGTTVA
jgi:hypothetical protein